jgi:hypothetical protein
VGYNRGPAGHMQPMDHTFLASDVCSHGLCHILFLFSERCSVPSLFCYNKPYLVVFRLFFQGVSILVRVFPNTFAHQPPRKVGGDEEYARSRSPAS